MSARIDLRSDTVTQPTDAMRAVMMAAPVGDDVLGDDPTVKALEAEMARALGKSRGLFVPSGTMANQLALRAHTRHGDEIMLHRRSHIMKYESGAPAALAGVMCRTFDTTDGSLPIDEVAAQIHQTPDPHLAPTTLICFENTHNGCGGRVVPQDNVVAVCALASSRGIATHLDGARLYNAAAASGLDVAVLAAPFDTVSVCLSKGLGAPVGSVLAGSDDAIARAYRFRKMYGGGMRQSGILAAAGLYALETYAPKLKLDHIRAKTLARALAEIPGIVVDPSTVESNLLYFDIAADHSAAANDADGVPALVPALAEHGIDVLGWSNTVRMVLHHHIEDAHVERTIRAVSQVMAS